MSERPLRKAGCRRVEWRARGGTRATQPPNPSAVGVFMPATVTLRSPPYRMLTDACRPILVNGALAISGALAAGCLTEDNSTLPVPSV